MLTFESVIGMTASLVAPFLKFCGYALPNVFSFDSWCELALDIYVFYPMPDECFPPYKATILRFPSHPRNRLATVRHLEVVFQNHDRKLPVLARCLRC